MENHEIPHYAARVGMETLEILWTNECWIAAEVLAEREIIRESAKRMLAKLQQYKPHQVIKLIDMSTQYLSIITIEDGLRACEELLRKPRLGGTLGSDVRVRKIIQMIMGEVRYGREITERTAIEDVHQRKFVASM